MISQGDYIPSEEDIERYGNDWNNFWSNIGSNIGNFVSWMNRGAGDLMNEITGTTASNEYNSAEAVKSREFTTAERLAAQEFNSAEAVKNWQRSEESAQRARDFTQMMDNTALQRRMADAEAAGVNPMSLFGGSGLSAGFQGSTAGSSSAATVSPGSSSNATAAGNSAAAVAGLIRTITTLITRAGK